MCESYESLTTIYKQITNPCTVISGKSRAVNLCFFYKLAYPYLRVRFLFDKFQKSIKQSALCVVIRNNIHKNRLDSDCIYNKKYITINRQ